MVSCGTFVTTPLLEKQRSTRFSHLRTQRLCRHGSIRPTFATNRRVQAPTCKTEKEGRKLSSNGKPSSTHESVEAGGSVSGSSSISGLARKIALAKNEFREALKEVHELQSSPLGYVTGADLSKFRISSTSIVQDLEIPSAPRHLDLTPEYVIAQVKQLLERKNVAQDECDQATQDMREILAAVRGWTSGFADSARQMLRAEGVALQGETDSKSIDALVTLLQLAGFKILPQLSELPEPPCPDALSLGNSIEKTMDPTLIQGSAAVRKHIALNGIRLGNPSYYPYLFIATRGVTVVRKSGLLIPQKLRAIERSYVGWIRTPFSLLLQMPLEFLKNMSWIDALRRRSSEPDLADPTSSTKADQGNNDAGEFPSSTTNLVRRVVPTARFGSVWESLRSLFLPTFTQEPAYELVLLMYREVVPDRAMIKRERRKALLKQLRESLAQAINPIPPGRKKSFPTAIDSEASVLDSFSKPLGEVKPLSLVMFGNVPWGTIGHFFPSTFVLPATRDLLRIDALTFIGLTSAIVTYFRNADNIFVYASLAASFVSYFVRVFFGLRQALTAYSGRISSEKASSIMGQQRSCVDSLAALAAEEVFVEAICVWLSSKVSFQITPQELEQTLFSGLTLTEESIATWRIWLKSNGF